MMMTRIRLFVLGALLTLLFGEPARAQMTSIQRQELLDQNLLGEQNPGFENGKARWTNSGSGTFTVTSTAANVAFGARSGSWDASAAADYLQISTGTLPAAALSGACEANFSYKGGDTSITAQVTDGTNVLVSRILTASTGFSSIRLPFTCPSSGAVILKFLATGNAAVMYLDGAWVSLARINPDVSPVVYSFTKQAVGSVGSSGQIALGHVLVAEDFPTSGSGVMFYNLASASDNSGNGVNFTATGSPVFTSTGILGAASSAMTLNGTSQYLKSTSSALQPTAAQHYYAGGWFKHTTWAAGKDMFNSITSLSDRGFGAITNGTSSILFNATNAANASSWSSGDIIVSGNFAAGSWHHVAVYFDATDTQFRVYVDGKRAGSVTLSDLRPAAAFKIGVNYLESGGHFAGEVDEFAVLKNVRLTDDDIRKLAAHKETHSRGVPTSEQEWVGTYSRSDDKLDQQMMPDWIVAQDSNSIYWDLSGLSSTSRFSAKLMQNGFTSTIVPAASYSTGELTSAPSTTISHGLPGRPQWVLVEQEGQIEATSWSPIDGVCWAKGDTQLACDFTGLTIDSTHRIRITANMTPGASAVREASGTRQGLVTSYAPSVVNGMCAKSADYTITDSDGCETIMMTTGASNRTLTLPAAASTNTGRRIKMIKADSGAGTAGFSGTISGSSSNNAIKAQYGHGTVISDGTSWYWDRDIEERGTWTPTLDSTGSSFGTVSYAAQNGFYERTGRRVHLEWYVEWSNTSATASSAMVTNNVPFTGKTSANYYSPGSCHTQTIDLSAGRSWMVPRMDNGASVIQFLEAGDSIGATTVGAGANSGAVTRYFICGMEYQIN